MTSPNMYPNARHIYLHWRLDAVLVCSNVLLQSPGQVPSRPRPRPRVTSSIYTADLSIVSR
jgi:hypothetical protein